MQCIWFLPVHLRTVQRPVNLFQQAGPMIQGKHSTWIWYQQTFITYMPLQNSHSSRTLGKPLHWNTSRQTCQGPLFLFTQTCDLGTPVTMHSPTMAPPPSATPTHFAAAQLDHEASHRTLLSPIVRMFTAVSAGPAPSASPPSPSPKSKCTGPNSKTSYIHR